LEETERILSVASALGASYIRLGVPGYNGSRPYGELLQEGRAYIREAEKLTRRYGIKGLVETHHATIAPSASLAHRLVEGCSPDAIGVLYDPGNLVHEGFEQYRMGLELLGPYLAHVHVKNAGWAPVSASVDPLDPASWRCAWQPVANGIVPWKRVLADLKAVGYEGAFGIEDFSGAYKSSEMLQLFVRQMNAWWEELQ
jgi:sugar phosphate isomerase/epimerase